MPRTIGIRELKNKATGVLRAVREEMAEYVVTHRGEPVAVLRSLTEDEIQRLRQFAEHGHAHRQVLQPPEADATLPHAQSIVRLFSARDWPLRCSTA